MILIVVVAFRLFQLPLICASGMDRYHAPDRWTTTMNPVVDRGTNTWRPATRHTPDFRLEEPMLLPWSYKYIEHNRPYRVSPHTKTTNGFLKNEKADTFGCYCTTVYKRLRPLAGCAMITRQHVLTTASSTELVLRRHRRAPSLYNILGVWYDIKGDRYFNSSVYGGPSRIHFHPLFTMPHRLNRTHPFPVMYDMAVWSLTRKAHWAIKLCSRGAPSPDDIVPSTPSSHCQYNIFGFQFIRAYGRRPVPWYKYMVRLNVYDTIIPCPKTEWGWFHCFRNGGWAPLGLDQGASLHRYCYGGTKRYGGMLGMNVLSVKLRSKEMVSYFNDVNTHKALDFFFNAYNGRLAYVWKDSRFEDTYNGAPTIFKNATNDPAPEEGQQKYEFHACAFSKEYRTGYR